jgi:hypothetical protein
MQELLKRYEDIPQDDFKSATETLTTIINTDPSVATFNTEQMEQAINNNAPERAGFICSILATIGSLNTEQGGVNDPQPNDEVNANVNIIAIPTSEYMCPDGKVRRRLEKYLPEHVVSSYNRLVEESSELFSNSEFKNIWPHRSLQLVSGYRSPAYQAAIMARMAALHGPQEARKFAAAPNSSQHTNKLKPALDFQIFGDVNGRKVEDSNGKPSDTMSMLLSPEFATIMLLGPEMGFWLPYYPDSNNPESGVSEKGIVVEPWHVQWVGSEESKRLMAENRIYEKLNSYAKYLEDKLGVPTIDFTKLGKEYIIEFFSEYPTPDFAS